MSRASRVWLVVYLADLVAIVAGMFWARQITLRTMDTPEAREQWRAWRESPPNQDSDGPVRRRPPNSTEPPALLLVRDHFAVILSGAVLFGSLLFAAIMLAARGAFAKGKPLQ
jgi:hypothetical protein